MNFAKISHKLLSYERAKAKLNEFAVPEEERNKNKLTYKSSIELLYSTVRVLSEFTDAYCSDKEITELYNDLNFVSRFYEAYVEAENVRDDYFFLLTGAIANIFSDNFGNAKSLLLKIDKTQNINYVAYIVLKYISSGLNISTNVSMQVRTENEKLLYLKIFGALDDELKNEEQSECADLLKDFAINTLRTADHESAFFANLLCALRKKYINNSAIRNIPQYSNSKLTDWNKYFKQKNAIKILWQAQKLLLDKDVLKGKSATIQLPTGVGKTKSIELIVSAAFLLRKVSLAIVVAPLRALCNEIKRDLLESIKDIVSISDISDVLSDDIKIDYTKKQVIVITPEKLSFLIKHDCDIVKKCGLIIFDEAHMFDDPSRGVMYELLVLRVKKLLSDEVQRVFISAVMPNAKELNEWLTDGKGETITDRDIKKTEKSVGFFSQSNNSINFFEQGELIEKREEMVFIPQICPKDKDVFVLEKYKKNSKTYKKGDAKSIFPNLSNSSDVALFLSCNLCKTGSVAVYVNQPGYIFSFSKRVKMLYDKEYPLLKNITDKSDKIEIHKIFTLAKEHFGDDDEFIKVMELGVFPHFGDLENGLRLSIEDAIKKQKIIYVVCTSTLAEGVNLPIRYLIATTFKKAFGQILSTRKFQNLLGRTARSGIHTEGSLICSDYKVIDERNTNSQMWENVVNLFNPSKSENCNSIILQIFEDIDVPMSYSKSKMRMKDGRVVNLYLEDYVKEFPEFTKAKVTLNDQHDTLSYRFAMIKNVIEALETALFDEINENNDGSSIAEKTLAYRLANDEQKILIKNLFEVVIDKVNSIPIKKRPIFSKTMNGIDILNKVDTYLQVNKKLYTDCRLDQEIWVNAIIELFESYVIKSEILKLAKEQKVRIINAWLEGKTYYEMRNLILELELHSIMKICQKDMGYSFNLLMSCIIELLSQYKPEAKTDTEWKTFIDKLVVFQQRLKYGLANEAEVAAYEFGFSDRVIARKIGILMIETYGERTIDNYKQLIIEVKDKIEKIIEVYPSYFSTVFKYLLP